ncbi:asparagine synthase (glutamine-hydrolyzing) [Magnetococcales bacterium HHB-1]
MCGICGYGGFSEAAPFLENMVEAIYHRGPNGQGSLVSGNNAIGMRRLSIIDLDGGQQPIFNENKNLAVVFNGEVYNYIELRKTLIERGHHFRTQTDTEVIIHLYEERGPACLDALHGMFTIAILDRQKETLFLARDRLGIKPLYIWQKPGKMIFASEIKSILAMPEVSREADLKAIDRYLTYRYSPGPETMFKGIRKFPAGHWMHWNAKTEPTLHRYWHPPEPSAPKEILDDKTAIDTFSEQFEEAVRIRLISDVPLGAYLSGGLDSNAIVAAMSRMVSQPVKTFSVGFGWPGDELDQAKESAQRLGCEHHEIICQAEECARLPDIVHKLDEPIGDAIVLPMHLLSQAASKEVKVILSGDGADEALGGYFMHKVLLRSRQLRHRIPAPLLRHILAPLLNKLPTALINTAFDYPAGLGQRGQRKLSDFIRHLPTRSLDKNYRFLISLFDSRDKEALYTKKMQHLSPSIENAPKETFEIFFNQMLLWQYKHWLPDDILTKQDKMTMANGIEGRVPFLDTNLLQFLASQPPQMKIRGRQNKWLLRRYLERVFPGEMSQRRKKPFYIPTENYLRQSPLKEMTQALLTDGRMEKRGLFNTNHVTFLLNSLNSGEFIYGKQIFSLVMLELWFRIFIDQEPGWIG